MSDKKCSKCSTEMRDVSAGASIDGACLQIEIFSAKAFITRYLCLSCGFTEEWLDEDNLKKARKMFKVE